MRSSSPSPWQTLLGRFEPDGHPPFLIAPTPDVVLLPPQAEATTANAAISTTADHRAFIPPPLRESIRAYPPLLFRSSGYARVPMPAGRAGRGPPALPSMSGRGSA